VATIAGRFVAARASFSAPSTASVPLLAKNEIAKSPGVISASRFASRPISGLNIVRPESAMRSSCSFTAAITRGWRWPSVKTP
jgi:hypothetical protein